MAENQYRETGANFYCPKDNLDTHPHCEPTHAGCRWNICSNGHSVDIKTKHVSGTPYAKPKGRGTR